jgi:iron complex outermembrane receptor protein
VQGTPRGSSGAAAASTAALALLLRKSQAATAAAAAFSSRVGAAETTVLSPFRVEAEFGLDGQRIQNSSAVLNSYLLEQQGIARLQDITGAAPNLASSNSDTRGYGDVLSLRGLTNSIFFTSPSVAYVIDDVPSISVSGYPSSLLGLESFTVKAGPQGTDYGRNAPGGVIDIKTRTPGAQHRGKVLLDYGSYKFSSVQAAFDRPISAQSGYSLAFGVSDRDGYLTNTSKKKTADDRSESAMTSRSRCSSAPTATHTWCVPMTSVASPPEPIRSVLPLRTCTSARSVVATYQDKRTIRKQP